MELEDFASKVRLIIYQLRTGKREQAYLSLAVVCLAAAGGLSRVPAPREPVPGVSLFQVTQYAEYTCVALASLFTVALAFRIWRQASVPPGVGSSATAPPAAIKGLNSFTEADGDLFEHLGRRTELQRLLAIAIDDQIGLCVVRGQSGAGKTSLLRAGLAFTLGKERTIYWEAVPSNSTDALLHAIRGRFPWVTTLDSLPAAFSDRCTLILDQFEQLSEKDPEHDPIFSLLVRIAKAPSPHKLSAVVAFRRDYAPDWLDFEQHHAFRVEQVPMNLLSPPAAGEALTSLASQAGFTLDQALVDNFTHGVTTSDGVSPIDVAIGLLGLANFVQQQGVVHVKKSAFTTSGGAEGLLISFAREKLDEIPEQVRRRLLTGLVVSLIDPSRERRVAEGATAAQMAAKAEISESLLTSYLERLTHPRIRLLEKVGSEHYRLPHERLVPVLRRLAGVTLARQDQARIQFEREFSRWMETKNRRHLLSSRDLRNTLAFRQSLIQGESGTLKLQYISASVRRRTWSRIVSSGAILVLCVLTYWGEQFEDARFQREKLSDWGLSPALFECQREADAIEIKGGVTDVGWLRSRRTAELHLQFSGFDLAPLQRLTGLKRLDLNLTQSNVKDLTELGKLTGLTELSLKVGPAHDLTSLEHLTGLVSLDLNVEDTHVSQFARLEKLTALKSLTLDLDSYQLDYPSRFGKPANGVTTLYLTPSRGNFVKVENLGWQGTVTGVTGLGLGFAGSSATDIEGLEKFIGLESLGLTLTFSQVRNLSALEKLTGLKGLRLNLSRSQVKDLTGLEKLTGLTWLDLNLGDSRVKDLTGLGKLIEMTSLRLRASDKVKDLSALEKLTGLSSLELDLRGSQVKDLSGLEKLTGLTSLTLGVSDKVNDLSALEKLTRLSSLELDLRGSQVKDLSGLEKLTELTSLTLELSDKVTDLALLEKLTRLTSLTLGLSDKAKDLTGLETLTQLNSLDLSLYYSQVRDLTGLGKLTGLRSLKLRLPDKVKDLTGLESLTQLTSLDLDLYDSSVRDLNGLEKLPKLTSLTLNLSDRFKSLTPLETLTQLTELKLDPGRSEIRDLAGLEKLTGLTSLTLDLDRSWVNNLSSLGSLTHLGSLKISAPLWTMSTFPHDDRIVHVADAYITVSPNDSDIKIPHGFKSVHLVE
jgi:hypothetical protein